MPSFSFVSVSLNKRTLPLSAQCQTPIQVSSHVHDGMIMPHLVASSNRDTQTLQSRWLKDYKSVSLTDKSGGMMGVLCVQCVLKWRTTYLTSLMNLEWLSYESLTLSISLPQNLAISQSVSARPACKFALQALHINKQKKLVRELSIVHYTVYYVLIISIII